MVRAADLILMGIQLRDHTSWGCACVSSFILIELSFRDNQMGLVASTSVG